MESISLEITGELPFEFDGDLLFSEDNQWTNNAENNRYHYLRVFEATDDEGDYYVVYFRYVTIWQGENDYFGFECAEDLKEVQRVIDAYDPVKNLVGFPDGDRFAKKQSKLRDKLIFDWNQLKIEAYADLGIKRESRGRKALGKAPRVNLNVTVDRELRDAAQEKGINFSEVLNDALVAKLASPKTLPIINQKP